MNIHYVSDINLSSLSFGSQLEIVNAEKDFCETIDGGFVPRQHLRKKEHFYSDPVSNILVGDAFQDTLFDPGFEFNKITNKP